MRIKKNKNKRLKENLLETIIEGFINEDPDDFGSDSLRKPGTVWRTRKGLWAGRRKNGTDQYGFKDRESAQRWVDNEPRFGSDGDKEQPQRQPASGDEEPTAQATTQDIDKMVDKAKAAGELPSEPPPEDGEEREEDPEQSRSRSIEQQIRREFPDAREVKYLDSFDYEQLKELGVYEGETDLPADMEARSPDDLSDYVDGGLKKEDIYKRLGKKARDEPRQTIEPELRTKLRQGGLPERYIDLIEISLNVDSSVKFSDLIDGVGAGQQASQFGELMSMAMMSLRNPADRAELAKYLKDKVQRGTIADKSWIDASVGHAEAFDAYMNELYGEGGWEFEGAAWDRKEDIEALGLDYKNKGFSTDAMLRVQPLDENGKPRGPAQAQRCSLKKDENVMFFNGGIGEINSLVRGYLSDDDRRAYAVLSDLKTRLGKAKGDEAKDLKSKIKGLFGIPEEQKLSDSAAKKLLDGNLNLLDQIARSEAGRDNRPAGAVLDRVNGFAEEQTKRALALAQAALNSEHLNRDAIANVPTDDIPNSQRGEAAKMLEVAMGCKDSDNFEKCIEGKGYKTQKLKSKLGTYLGAIAAVGDEDIKKKYQEHIDEAAKLGDQFMELFNPDDNPVMFSGLMQTLAEKFPLNVAMSGTEFMVINGTHAGPETLQKVFGVDSYEDLQKGLQILEVDGKRMLAYTMAGSDEPMLIGLVQARQKGRGYNPIGFEIQCADSFVLACAEANEANAEEHDRPQSDANLAAIKRIGGREDKRKQKKTKEESLSPREQQLHNELKKLVRDIAINRLGKYGN